MKKLLLLVIGVLVPILNFGQSELAMINDSTDFVYVQADKNPDTKVLKTIKKGDFFFCEPTEEYWWKVNCFDSQIGFIPKAKVQLIKDLTDNQQRNLIVGSINRLKDYRFRYDSLQLVLTYDKTRELLREFENYEETVYIPLLPFLSKLLCKNKDFNLLGNFLDLMVVNKMSASESSAWVLGNCYLCHPDFVLHEINKYEIKDKEFLKSILVWGFENIFLGKGKEIQNYQRLRVKLRE